jgi:hypothetical protein
MNCKDLFSDIMTVIIGYIKMIDLKKIFYFDVIQKKIFNLEREKIFVS